MKTSKKICILSVFLAICLCFSSFLCTNTISHIDTSVYAETITEKQADVAIWTYEDLLTVATATKSGTTYSGKKVALFANITVKSNFSGIGTYSSVYTKAFKGTFYGNGYNISGLKTPLFNYTDYAKIYNVEISPSSSQKEINSASQYVGSIVAYAKNTTIKQCLNTTKVTNSYSSNNKAYTGGLVGYAYNCIFNQCANQADVRNTSSSVKESYVGGIVGYAEKTTFNDCFTYASTITANAKDASTSAKNILSGQQKTHLTEFGSKITALIEKYKKEQEALKSDNAEKQALIDDYYYYANLSNTYVAYGDWVGGREQASWWPHPWYWNAHHSWDPSKKNDWDTFWKRQEYGAIAAVKWAKLGIKGDWATAFKAGWATLKANLANTLKSSLDRLYSQYKSFTANNHYSFVEKKTKETKSVPAYAFGIAYTKTCTVNRCYTANVTLSAGQMADIYKYSMYFTNEVKFVTEDGVAKARTGNIDITITQTDNLKGLISNSVNNYCYFYNNENRNLTLKVTATNMSSTGEMYNTSKNQNESFNTATMTGSYKMDGNILNGVIPTNWFTTQKAEIRIDKYGSVSIYGAQNGTGKMCKITIPDMTTPYSTAFENYNLGTKQNTKTSLPTGFDSSVWIIDSAINNGYPILKYRYWKYAQ